MVGCLSLRGNEREEEDDNDILLRVMDYESGPLKLIFVQGV